MLQDYTRVELDIQDEVNQESLKDVELIIKDEKGKEVTTYSIKDNEKQENEEETPKQEQEENVLERLPVGTYLVESTKMPYGYKEVFARIYVKDRQGLQINIIQAQREEFDLSVEAWVNTIKRNGQIEYENKKATNTVKKVDIKDKKIGTEDIQISYKMKIENPGKIIGQVGKIEVNVPQGMIYEKENNKGYWKQEGKKIVSQGLAGRNLNPGDYAEVELNLKWKNGLENFGTKALEVSILETKSDNGFEETNMKNNQAKAGEVIIGVSTGQMNLVYACWILLAILIAVEIIISRKTKIKKFGLKDRTLKYKDK